ncbi:cache domain-containing sensor histidine kinase [Paenibacillus mendelii]|uniref:histidine kinase n=1 Tax=Paenibacillus mendelii TaxID=206163 RepID=A0ABV6JKE1_9BACL|nr:histidine kinase [Paenibacillus mendelii]MCQ6559213.1 sensor histidine kinase [Paenibacillus mendelii]
MKFRMLYRQYLKNNMFFKLILLFACITILTIVTLSYFLYTNMTGSITRNELDKQKQAMESVDSFINGKFESVQAYVTDIYRDAPLSQNIYYLLKNPFDDYLKYRLDKYYSDDVWTGLNNGLEYFQRKLDRDADIQNLIVYSAERQYMYVYNQGAASRLIETNASRSYIPDVMAMETGSVTAPNPWIRQAIGQKDPEIYSVRTPINDMRTLKNIGQLVVYFNSEGIKRALTSFDEPLTGYVLVMSTDGQVIFDSSGRYYGGRYPYEDKIKSLYETAMLEEESYVTTLTSRTGYIVVGVAPKREIESAYHGLKRTIIMISAACILVAIILPALLVINLAKRTNNIIRFTRKVKSGEMTARIQDDREDELGQISRSFNEMLDELVRYINRVYKAEIKQKHTELAAIQARVNPHFLYNTLEVIRMRAISQGAKDVGEMIYSLSTLFKNLVRARSVYTLKDELEACRLYLELFRIRYKDKFTYEIIWDEQLADRQIMRMSLQPIIENYIMHGLRTESSDNLVTIRVTEDEGILCIKVQDNGSGITEDKLESIRKSFIYPDPESGSFGLSSIQERHKLMYGSDSGIDIQSTVGEGTTVTFWFPAVEGDEAEDV